VKNFLPSLKIDNPAHLYLFSARIFYLQQTKIIIFAKAHLINQQSMVFLGSGRAYASAARAVEAGHVVHKDDVV
jgi:hypothetical protein